MGKVNYHDLLYGASWGRVPIFPIEREKYAELVKQGLVQLSPITGAARLTDFGREKWAEIEEVSGRSAMIRMAIFLKRKGYTEDSIILCKYI